MNDLEKFEKFFAEYGITFYQDHYGFYHLDGDDVKVPSFQRPSWHFDKDGNFIKIDLL